MDIVAFRRGADDPPLFENEDEIGNDDDWYAHAQLPLWKGVQHTADQNGLCPGSDMSDGLGSVSSSCSFSFYGSSPSSSDDPDGLPGAVIDPTLLTGGSPPECSQAYPATPPGHQHHQQHMYQTQPQHPVISSEYPVPIPKACALEESLSSYEDFSFSAVDVEATARTVSEFSEDNYSMGSGSTGVSGEYSVQQQQQQQQKQQEHVTPSTSFSSPSLVSPDHPPPSAISADKTVTTSTSTRNATKKRIRLRCNWGGCKYRASSRDDYLQHVSGHQKCPKDDCEWREAKEEKEVLRHVWNTHGKWAMEKGLPSIGGHCDECGKNFKRQDYVRRHKAEVHRKEKRNRKEGG